MDELRERFLNWRNIDPEFDEICTKCGGAGIRMYGSTSTWYGGVGGQAITMDVCDGCWGSGKTNDPGTNLKRLLEKYRGAINAVDSLVEAINAFRHAHTLGSEPNVHRESLREAYKDTNEKVRSALEIAAVVKKNVR